MSHRPNGAPGSVQLLLARRSERMHVGTSKVPYSVMVVFSFRARLDEGPSVGPSSRLAGNEAILDHTGGGTPEPALQRPGESGRDEILPRREHLVFRAGLETLRETDGAHGIHRLAARLRRVGVPHETILVRLDEFAFAVHG